jgi:hydroxylamine reductase
MFCFQCEQTAHCTGCTGAPASAARSPPTARLQDALTGALIGLATPATARRQPTENTYRADRGPFHHHHQRKLRRRDHPDMIAQASTPKSPLAPGCAACASRCGSTDDYDMESSGRRTRTCAPSNP